MLVELLVCMCVLVECIIEVLSVGVCEEFMDFGLCMVLIDYYLCLGDLVKVF